MPAHLPCIGFQAAVANTSLKRGQSTGGAVRNTLWMQHFSVTATMHCFSAALQVVMKICSKFQRDYHAQTNRAANSAIHTYSPRSPPAICTLTPQGCYAVRVSGVAATVCAAASPAVFPLATVCPEWLPVIALAVVEHAPDPSAITVRRQPIRL
jgi:hypothetical protein